MLYNKENYNTGEIMNLDNIEKEIKLICPICGNDQFSSLDVPIDELKDGLETNRIQCSDCHRIFTKEELLNENQEQIDNEIEQITDDIKKQLGKEIKKMFRKFK